MSAARGNANQALYLARLLLDGWRHAHEAQDVPARTLNQAFAPAVRSHLLHSYGWFLLEIAHLDGLPEAQLPTSVVELPVPVAGRAEAAELRELRRLESTGFIAELILPPAAGVAAVARAGALTAANQAGPDLDDMGLWADKLAAMYARMRDSLDEY